MRKILSCEFNPDTACVALNKQTAGNVSVY